jgi:DNA-directed RNA polymerase specialized sigma24 family protein
LRAKATFRFTQGVGLSTQLQRAGSSRQVSDIGSQMAERREFDEFVVTRSSRLLRTAFLLTRDWALAEDLLQTALAKSWFVWGRLDDNPEPYVRKVLVNTYASWWRRRWRAETPTESLPDSQAHGAKAAEWAANRLAGRPSDRS